VAGRLGPAEFLGEPGPYILSFVYLHLLDRPTIRKLEEWFGGTEIPDFLGLGEIATGRLYETLGYPDMALYLAYAIMTFPDHHLRDSGYSAIEFLEKLRCGHRIYLKDRKSGHSWKTDVLLERKLYKYFDSLQAAA